MSWLDAVLLQLSPALVVLSVLLVIVPSLRRRGSWRGIGAAWLATFVVTVLVAVTHPDGWTLNCDGLGILPGGWYIVAGSNAPCTASNALPPWLVALAPLAGITILVAWVGRHTRPLPIAARTVGGLAAVVVFIIALGQVNGNAALLAVIVVAAAAWFWPRVRRPIAA